MKVAERLAEFGEQAAAAADWLARVPESEFERPSVLAGWDVRTLVGHLVLMRDGVIGQLATRADGPATPIAEFVARYRPAVAAIAAKTMDATGDHSPGELIERLRVPLPVPEGIADRSIVRAARGPILALDWVDTRLIELVVHCDDLSRSLPEREPVELYRPALATAVRTLAEIMAAQAPGHAVELRVPPFVAVQAVAGPRHTRGTPPNVVETDPLTWLRIATGRTAFAASVADGRVRASGNRADLAPHLPLLR